MHCRDCYGPSGHDRWLYCDPCWEHRLEIGPENHNREMANRAYREAKALTSRYREAMRCPEENA